jgi:hypothetical protein
MATRQKKTADVFLPLPRPDAIKWLRARAIPFSHMRDHFKGVAFRIRRGYELDFQHEKDKSAGRPNPARRRARAASMLKGRRRRGRNPSGVKKYETKINGLHVKFFQGYAEDVRYIRQADGKPYSHVVETDAAELYLAEHSVYGRCILIVDPSGKTPLWG